tara:strand:- start:79 stop:510 length:432 start_codon:yes stop_codon:yes gene_type:complete
MASNIKYPENQAMYFIEGDKLTLLTNVDSDGTQRTTSRKKLKAISESVTDGILIHYYSEPNSVTSVNSEIDIDNALQPAIVDFVKKCLYMDKAGSSGDLSASQVLMSLSMRHEKDFNNAIKRFGVRKKDKTGGTRVVKVPNLI